MSDRSTPETDRAEYEVRLGRHWRKVVRPKLCRDLERQRDAYAETMRDILRWDLPIADTIRARHPELAEND